MTTILATCSIPRRRSLLGQIKAWLAARPTRRQRRTTIDLRSAPPHLQRDLGLENLIYTERRW